MKKILLISLLTIVILGSGSAGAYYFLGMRINPDDEETVELVEGEEVVEEEPVELRPALYKTIPAMVVSANYQGRLRYLQVKMSILTREEATLEKLENSTPIIQDGMIMLLNNYPFNELETPAGKEELRHQAEEKVKELIADEGVESVLFTGFVIQ
ncbi:MAG: flagellar basal body-associated FliL family protein [Gammaproteobacteria bacterium]